MLILSRRKGEKVIIENGLIEITVVSILGNRIRLGIQAPEDIRVDRSEIHEKRQEDIYLTEQNQPSPP